MIKICTFKQQKRGDRWIQNESKRFCLLLSCCTLLGCGGDAGSVGERLSGPAANAALPIRIDATVTPTPTSTPDDEVAFSQNDAEEVAENEDEFAPETENALKNMTPLPSTDDKTQEDEDTTDNELSPTPTSLPLPTETPAPAEKSESGESSETVSTESAPAGKEEKSVSSKKAPSKKASKKPKEQEKTSKSTSSSKTQQSAPNADFTLAQVKVCSKIANRTPTGIANQFSLSQVRRVYTWIKVSGVKPTAYIKHIYYREGKLIARVKLKLKYASMRTWSQKTFKPEESLGSWKVVVTTEDEKKILATREFTVVP